MESRRRYLYENGMHQEQRKPWLQVVLPKKEKRKKHVVSYAVYNHIHFLLLLSTCISVSSLKRLLTDITYSLRQDVRYIMQNYVFTNQIKVVSYTSINSELYDKSTYQRSIPFPNMYLNQVQMYFGEKT